MLSISLLEAGFSNNRRCRIFSSSKENKENLIKQLFLKIVHFQP